MTNSKTGVVPRRTCENARAYRKKTRPGPATRAVFACGMSTASSFTASHGEVCGLLTEPQWKPDPPVRAALSTWLNDGFATADAKRELHLTVPAGDSVPQWRRTF